MKLTISRAPIAVATALLLSISCGHDATHGHDHGDGSDHSHDAPAELVAAPAPSANASVHAVRCGCSIESVGACGEFIEVDGELVALELPVDMGPMPFCGRDGLKAKVDGEMKDETFVATTFAYVD